MYGNWFEGTGSSGEGIQERVQPGGVFSLRQQTADLLLDKLQQRKACIITSPPRTGKTSLCQLVLERAERSTTYQKLYYVNCSPISPARQFGDVFQSDNEGTSFAQAARSPASSPVKEEDSEVAHAAGTSASMQPSPSIAARPTRTRRKTLIIIDEAQQTYAAGAGADELVKFVKALAVHRRDSGVNILFAASLGSVLRASDVAPTPYGFEADQRIRIRYEAFSKTSL